VPDAVPGEKGFQLYLPFWTVLLELNGSDSDVDFLIVVYHSLGGLHRKYQVLSPVTIFQRKSGLLSAMVMSLPLILIWSSHCSCVSILCTVGWQNQWIFRSLLRWCGNHQSKFWLSLHSSLPSDDDQSTQSPVSHCPHTTVLLTGHCVGHHPTIHNHPWTCDTTEASLIRTAFVYPTLSETSAKFPSPTFPIAGKIIILPHHSRWSVCQLWTLPHSAFSGTYYSN
jgi:hypothetical protein